MKCIFIFLLTGIFGFSSLPIDPASFSHAQAKHCCCKTGICKCQHAGGKMCPLQKQTRMGNRNPMPNAVSRLLASGNCGSHEEKMQLPNYAKDYFFQEDREFFILTRTSYLMNRSSAFQFLFDTRFKQPPRNV